MKKLFIAVLSFSSCVILLTLFTGNRSGFTFKAGELSANSNSSIWTDVAETDLTIKGERQIIPDLYRTVHGKFSDLTSLLSSAPMEYSDKSGSIFIFELPLPDGGLSRFSVTEYHMMEPGLALKFPDIKTYNIKGIDDPYAIGKMDITMHGFHAMVLSPRGDYFIDPYSSKEKDVYISYYKKDFTSDKVFKCDFDPEVNIHDSEPMYNRGSIVCGPELRSYRLACAATGEYTTFHGGTVAAGQAAIVVCINRLNGVYEKDFAVRMVLIANNDTLVYTSGSSDPYTNNNGGAMLGQNQSNLDNVIGSANYDFGHVVSTGGGGVANLRVICVNGQKARGVTGLGSPIGDPFYIDYVAHEMGHQFGGNHSFNSTTSSCGGGNRNASTAWEPGSGSTIMSYAGICGSSNLQNNSDDYFHSGNFTEMESFVQFGSGSTCPQIINTGNTPPTVTVPTGGFTIPVRTAFQLTGNATDIENPNSLTYCWEEMDLGPAGVPNSPSGNAPIFRSFKPDTSATRLFPKLSNLLNNTQTIGEILPTYTRDLSFRLTVRDNNIAGGGVNYEFMEFHVTDSAGPFKVTQPDTSITWNSNIPQTVIWDVANTNAAPVNCSVVNIKLSTNGGLTFSTTLVSNTPNDGSQIVTLPAILNNQARIKIEAADNVFFDISNYNFTLSNLISISAISSAIPENFSLLQNYPNPFNPVTNVEFGIPKSGFVSLKIYDVLGKEAATLVNTSLNPGTYKYNFEASAMKSGIYFYTLKVSPNDGTGEFIETRKMLLVK